ncbi:MAG: KH domain-containing protein, partial [Chloroflexota bacterium]
MVGQQIENGTAAELCALVDYIARQLVDYPEDMRIESDQQGQMVRVYLRVHPEDMGRVIGREGRIARAMRTLLMIAASRRG